MNQYLADFDIIFMLTPPNPHHFFFVPAAKVTLCFFVASLS